LKEEQKKMDENIIRPCIGITMGDPSGIGPEITVKSLKQKEIYEICKPLVIGDKKTMEQACKIAAVDLEINGLASLKDRRCEYGIIDVLDMQNVDLEKLVHGQVSKMAGKASLDYIYKTIDLAMEGEIDATVTNPIHKEAINKAGSVNPGHTEIFKERTGSKDVAMMLVKDEFKIVHVSTHVSLKKACELVKEDRVFKVIKLANQAMRNLNILNPKIAVSGLNPHAGEGGLFGDEEINEIKPAVRKAQQEGINVEGPLPPDTAFAKARGGQCDVIIAMFHDQGHIPAKLVGFIWDEKKKKWIGMSGVNVTLGLPIIRTSVDHGVAFGKAGKGQALPDSLIEAIKLAAVFASKSSHSLYQ